MCNCIYIYIFAYIHRNPDYTYLHSLQIRYIFFLTHFSSSRVIMWAIPVAESGLARHFSEWPRPGGSVGSARCHVRKPSYATFKTSQYVQKSRQIRWCTSGINTNTRFPIDPGIPWWSVLDPGGSYWKISESLFAATISTRRARPVPPRCADTRACWMAVRSLDACAVFKSPVDWWYGDGVVHGCTMYHPNPSNILRIKCNSFFSLKKGPSLSFSPCRIAEGVLCGPCMELPWPKESKKRLAFAQWRWACRTCRTPLTIMIMYTVIFSNYM